MGLDVGDRITINVLGRDIEAQIANLRAIDWTSLGINFTLIFAPGALEAAPHTHIATAQVAAGYEDAVERAVTDRFANVSAIRIKDALATVDRMLASIAVAARATAALTLAAGILVLTGAVIATQRRRIYDAVGGHAGRIQPYSVPNISVKMLWGSRPGSKRFAYMSPIAARRASSIVAPKPSPSYGVLYRVSSVNRTRQRPPTTTACSSSSTGGTGFGVWSAT